MFLAHRRECSTSNEMFNSHEAVSKSLKHANCEINANIKRAISLEPSTNLLKVSSCNRHRFHHLPDGNTKFPLSAGPLHLLLPRKSSLMPLSCMRKLVSLGFNVPEAIFCRQNSEQKSIKT